MDASWNFINKIWNASRFVIMNVEGMTAADIDFSGEKTVADRWILTLKRNSRPCDRII